MSSRAAASSTVRPSSESAAISCCFGVSSASFAVARRLVLRAIGGLLVGTPGAHHLHGDLRRLVTCEVELSHKRVLDARPFVAEPRAHPGERLCVAYDECCDVHHAVLSTMNVMVSRDLPSLA